MKRLWMVGLVFLNLSCSSYFTRKSCEKVNWFQHTYNIAMEGKRPEEDPRYKECEKAETEINAGEVDRGFKAGMEAYCRPDTAFTKGTNGDGFNYDFCDSNMGPRLRARHMEGVKAFCNPDAGYSFASKGGIYKNQCPKDLETAFMVKYRRGRHIFLKNQIASNEGQIRGIDGEIREQQNLRSNTSQRIALLPRTKVVNQTKTYDPVTKSYKQQTAVTEDPNITRQREDLKRELRSINSQIQNKQEEQRRLREQIHQYRAEMEALK